MLIQSIKREFGTVVTGTWYLISSTMKSSMGWKTFDAMMKEKDLRAKRYFVIPSISSMTTQS
jgi:hypothetical protein